MPHRSHATAGNTIYYDKRLKNPAWRVFCKNNMNVLYCFRVLTIADLVKETANTTDFPGVQHAPSSKECTKS